MSKYFKEFPEYDGKSRVNFLTETLSHASEPDGANFDYSDITAIGELYRETRMNLNGALYADGVNFVFEVKKGKYNTKDFLSDKEIDARSEKSKGVLKALKDSIAKDVMCDRMSTAVAKKSGALGKNAELFKGVFDRGVFNSVSVAETNANAKEFISKITDEKVSQDEKANLIKDRIEKMSKIASEMRIGDEKNFTENFEKYMDYSYALKGLGDLNKIAVNYGIVLDKITMAKAQELSNFGNRFRKLCVAKAEQMIDPAYVTLNPDKAESYYDGISPEEIRGASFFKDGELSFEEVSDNLCGTLVKLNLLEKGLDPDKSVICLSKNTEKIITFDELGTAVHGKEPVIVFGDDGEFKSYIEFRNDGSAYEVENVKKIDLDMTKEDNVKEMKDVFNDFQKQFKKNDAFYKSSSAEYKKIQELLDVHIKYGEAQTDDMDSLKTVTVETLKELAETCDKYLENSANKEKLSDYAKKRIEIVQQLRRTAQVSLSAENVKNYLEKNKEVEKPINETKLEDFLKEENEEKQNEEKGAENGEKQEEEKQNEENKDGIEYEDERGKRVAAAYVPSSEDEPEEEGVENVDEIKEDGEIDEEKTVIVQERIKEDINKEINESVSKDKAVDLDIQKENPQADKGKGIE